MDLSALNGKRNYFLAVFIILIGCLFIYQFFLAGWLTEGQSTINFEEVNETVASSGHIVHLTDQEYKDFPELKEFVENPNAKPFRGMGKQVTVARESYIMNKYRPFGADILEYNGKYYTFTRMLH